MNATSWIFRRLTQNEFKAITDQIQSEGGGSQTYIDLPKGKISDTDLTSFFGEGTQIDKGYKWEVPVYSLSLDMQPQDITISQRRDSSNCIREQNRDKRINIWKSEYSDFPNDSYSESENPIYIFILKSDDENFYAGWFYAKDYKDNWFLTKNLCKPLFGESCGYAVFDTPITIEFNDFHWPFRSLFHIPTVLPQKYHNEPLQVIYYGAPGTGKSHKIKRFLEEHNVPKENIFRTTFHPDSDYSTFVGSYKPSKGLKKMYGLNGGTTVAMELGGNHLEEEVITYQFIPQAFLLAYIQAYKKPEENVFLVIEEINRGNCAQIFGDLFQLLDRDDNGKSDYTIKADTDLKKFLIDELGKDNEGISGGELCLPSNLYIFATMNTSDQSLFPIDSAFKRRWDWEYEPIKYKNIDWMIEIDNIRYSWVEFQKEVNNRILKDTGSEDKMMGDYFVKPHDKIISKKLFLNKVLFYLWTDVCKDGDCDIFPTENDFSFSKLYDENSSQTIHSLMENLGINPVSDTATDDSTESDKSDGGNDSSKKLPKYTLDGNPERLTTPKAVLKVIENYAKQHGDASVDEMIKLWNDISERKNCLVADWTPSENDNQPFANKRRSEIKWGDNKSVWVINGWTEELFKIFTHNAKEKLGISIEKVE